MSHATIWNYYVTIITNCLTWEKSFVIVSARMQPPKGEEIGVSIYELNAGPFASRDEARAWIEQQQGKVG